MRKAVPVGPVQTGVGRLRGGGAGGRPLGATRFKRQEEMKPLHRIRGDPEGCLFSLNLHSFHSVKT